MHVRLVACFAFAGTILTCGARARAQGSDLEDRARSWYDQAAREFAAGSYGVAARDFLAADTYGPSPTALEMALRAAQSSRDDAMIAAVIARARGRSLPPEVADHVRDATKKVLSSLGEIEVVCDPKPRDGRCTRLRRLAIREPENPRRSGDFHCGDEGI